MGEFMGANNNMDKYCEYVCIVTWESRNNNSLNLFYTIYWYFKMPIALFTYHIQRIEYKRILLKSFYLLLFLSIGFIEYLIFF